MLKVATKASTHNTAPIRKTSCSEAANASRSADCVSRSNAAEPDPNELNAALTANQLVVTERSRHARNVRSRAAL